MSDIIIDGDNCAIILSKEEAMLIFALVGRLPSSDVAGSGSIFSTILESGFISMDEYHAWWRKHALKARIDLECGAEQILPGHSIMLVVKKP